MWQMLLLFPLGLYTLSYPFFVLLHLVLKELFSPSKYFLKCISKEDGISKTTYKCTIAETVKYAIIQLASLLLVLMLRAHMLCMKMKILNTLKSVQHQNEILSKIPVIRSFLRFRSGHFHAFHRWPCSKAQ